MASTQKEEEEDGTRTCASGSRPFYQDIKKKRIPNALNLWKIPSHHSCKNGGGIWSVPFNLTPC